MGAGASRVYTYGGFYAHKQGQHPTAVATAPPIQIFHPIFQGLSDRIDDPAFEPGEEVVSIVSKPMPMCRHGDTLFIENALTKLFPLITDLLDWYVGQVLLTGTRTPDGMMFKQLGQCIVPLICTKYNYASGEGGCGPLTQTPCSVRELLDLDQVCGFRVFLHLPLTQL